MLWPASPEYVALCQAQAELMVQTLGVSSVGIYLTEESGDRRSWLPVLVYPESPLDPLSLAPPASLFAAPESYSPLAPDSLPPDPLKADELPVNSAPLVSQSESVWPLPDPVLEGEMWPDIQPESEHLIFPLIHEAMPLGVMVVRRVTGNWLAWEHAQLQQVAATLAIGCVMDQRHQWLLQAQAHPWSQQQEILANLLHQFRNPLMALQTLTKLLLKRLQPPDPNRPVVESLWQEGHRLQRLVEQFQATLETDPPTFAAGVSSNLSLAAAPLRLTAADWVTTIQPLLPAIQARAQELGIEMHWEWDQTLPPVLLDPEAMQEVVGNLLDNACKYTAAGGNIYLQTRELTPQTQGLLIMDTGMGIPAADLVHLGERGYRGQQATGTIPGTGLGLAIAKHLMAEMGGSLTVQSPFPPDSDHGTAVLLTLNHAPIRPPA